MKMDNGQGRVQRSSSGAAAVKPRKKKMSRGVKILLGVIIVLAVFGLVMGGLVWRKYAIIREGQDKANALYPVTDVSTGDTSSEAIDPSTGIIPSFNNLHQENQDVIGHLSIADTKLKTPVVQGTDNEYYLNHNFFKESTLGVPFADFKASITGDYVSDNITIYGHAAKDGSYFAPVKLYRTVDYYKAHPIVQFDTIYGKGQYKIIGAFVARVANASSSGDPEEFNYQDYMDLTEETFNQYISEIDKRSYFDTGVDVKYGDKLITLSTCDDEIIDSLSTPYRMVVVARKVRDGESASVDTSKAAANTDMIMPKAWSEKNGGKANPYQ